MASRPDTRQDADLQIRIPAHWLDTLHRSTDQKVGGSSPSERANVATGQSLAAWNRRGADSLSGGLISRNFSQP